LLSIEEVLPMPQDTQLVSLPWAAARLGKSVDTIRRKIAAGELPAVRVGARSLRVRVADVEALVQSIGPDELR
jgi:excisionase family DNA binding protein